MHVVKNILDLYIRGSIHVAVAVVSFIGVTGVLLDLNINYHLYGFAFTGAIAAYNAIKFVSVWKRGKEFSSILKLIGLLTICAVIAAVFFFYNLGTKTQIAGIVAFVLVVCYAVPVFGAINLRNISGLKIYLIALCYIIVTVLMPAYDSGFPLSNEIAFVAAARFFLIFVLLLIFDIADLAHDAAELRTIPQQLGLFRTRVLGTALLMLFCILHGIFARNINILMANIVLAMVVAIFLWFASPRRSKYFSDLFLESVPMFWLLLLILVSYGA
jgi:hypothetical protein